MTDETIVLKPMTFGWHIGRVGFELFKIGHKHAQDQNRRLVQQRPEQQQGLSLASPPADPFANVVSLDRRKPQP